MEQSSTQPAQLQQKPHRFRRFLPAIIIVAAIGAIVTSIVVLMNPGGVQTSANEASSSIAITERGVAPAVVTVKKGDSITWVNQDNAPHSIALSTPNPPKELEGFGSGDALAKGESYSFIFEAAGTYTYEDPDNPGLIQGQIIVEDN